MDHQNLPIADFELASSLAIADGLRQSLSLARALASRGRPVELDGVQGGVGLLCAKALDLPPEQGRLFRLSLIALRDEIDRLSSALRGELPPA